MAPRSLFRSAIFFSCVFFVVLPLWAVAPAGADPCDQEEFFRKMNDCGFDADCMNRVTSEFNEQCQESSQNNSGDTSAPPVSIPGLNQTGGLGDLLKGLQETAKNIADCHGDPDCIANASDDLPELPESDTPGAESSDFDTTYRIGESSLLPPSWLQTYQEAMVNCGNDAACFNSVMSSGEGKIASVCGPMPPRSKEAGICWIIAKYELQIEQAIAQQRIAAGKSTWRSLFQGGGSGSQGTDPTPPESIEQRAAGLMNFLDEVPFSKVRQITTAWQRTLEQKLAPEALEKISTAAESYPLQNSDPSVAPLVFEATETAHTIQYDIKPSSRDWAYAMIGLFLTQTGLADGSKEGLQLRDYGFWCMLKAAELSPIADHFCGIGFHLNLRAALEDAKAVLSYARALDPENADTSNNLAFAYQHSGQEEEALALQQCAVGLAPDDTHIRSRLNQMLGIEDDKKSFNDYGEAFARLGRRHTAREYQLNEKWRSTKKNHETSLFGGKDTIPGPFMTYKKEKEEIEATAKECLKALPKSPVWPCPSLMHYMSGHPDCKDAPDPKAFAAHKKAVDHNIRVRSCQCHKSRIEALSDALKDYIDMAALTQTRFEQEWWPSLNWYKSTWSKDIAQVNSKSAIPFPVPTTYYHLPDDLLEESDDFWNNRLASLYEKWAELENQSQNFRECGTEVQVPDVPKKEPAPQKPPEKTSVFSINLVVFKMELSADGVKTGFDLGVIKGGYEHNSVTGGSKFTLGSGPVEASYIHGGKTGSGFSVALSTNILKFAPGGDIAGQFLNIGSKFEGGWTSKKGWTASGKGQTQTSIGFSYKQKNAVSYQN